MLVGNVFCIGSVPTSLHAGLMEKEGWRNIGHEDCVYGEGASDVRVPLRRAKAVISLSSVSLKLGYEP